MKQYINSFIEENRETFISLSDRIWEYAETRFEEYRSADAISRLLEENGFAVERGIAGIESAFRATFGEGKPVIGLLGEYDALSGLSQEAGSDSKVPVEQDGNGHGCGHNLLGTAPLAAAITVKQYMQEYNIKGTIQYYGCPGEEGGSGKTFMVREGAFDKVDAALTWHPNSFSGVFSFSSLANYQVYFSFTGTPSHAANSPHLGRSALDAVELMNVGVNYLREHIIPEAKIHYAITNAGGISPNVVQGEAEVLYLIRGPKISDVEEIYQRVINIAKGAALMTGTNVQLRFDKACSNYIPNKALGLVVEKHLAQFGLPEYDSPEELDFAEKISKTITEEERWAAAHEIEKVSGKSPKEVMEELGDANFFPEIYPSAETGSIMPGSTDVGDVSWVVPTVQFFESCFVAGTPLHTWQLVSQGKTSLAHKGMLQASKVLAASALELLTDGEALAKAKDEFAATVAGQYKNPIPPDVKPSKMGR